jgi:hypothetical protein
MSTNWSQLAEQLRFVRAQNEVSIALRRGETELAPQPMRIEYVGRHHYRLQTEAARDEQTYVYILGEKDMDIQPEDRLTFDGHLIRVEFIQINRLAATIAEGIVLE